jgi:hypothetical protein
LSKNFSFYPTRFQNYLFTPVCAQVFPKLWYRQLAAWYAFDPGAAQELLITDELKKALLHRVQAAYEKARIKPQQKGKGSGLKDKVFTKFLPEITKLEKQLRSRDLVAELQDNAEFLSELRDLQARVLAPNASKVKLFEPKSVQRTVAKIVQTRHERPGPVSTGDVWRRASVAAASTTQDKTQDKLFAFAVCLVFGPGDLDMAEQIWDVRDDSKFVLEILLQEFCRGMLVPSLISRQTFNDLLEYLPVLNEKSLANYVGLIHDLFV